MEGNYQSSNKLRENSFSFEDHTLIGSSTSWPARNYACSFCKREFRSAQALGGHMNVHRRDRARMRSGLPYWVSEYPKPNPNNPSFLISSSSSAASPNLSDDYLPHAHHSPLYSPPLTLSSSPSSAFTSTEDKRSSIMTSSQLPLLSTTPHCGETKMHKNKRSGLGFEELKGFGEQDDQHKGFKKNENIISLELGIGLLKHPNEKLDLELRL